MNYKRKPINTNRFSFLKLLLNLLVMASLFGIGIIGYNAFSHKLSPIVGTLSFLAVIGLFIWLVNLIRSKKYRWRKPSFKLVFWSVLGILLVCTFTGLQPLANYKDAAIGKITNFINEQEIKSEARRVAEENRKAIEKAEMDAVGVVSEYYFYKEYAVIFNEFRENNGRAPLIFDVGLNALASERVIEISQPGNFSHKGIEAYNLGENIAMMAYASDSPDDLLQQWAESLGHRSNMLSTAYHRTGFAKNREYAVQLFD